LITDIDTFCLRFLLVYIPFLFTSPSCLCFLLVYVSFLFTFPSCLRLLLVYVSFLFTSPCLLLVYSSFLFTIPSCLRLLPVFVYFLFTFTSCFRLLLVYVYFLFSFTCCFLDSFLFMFPSCLGPLYDFVVEEPIVFLGVIIFSKECCPFEAFIIFQKLSNLTCISGLPKIPIFSRFRIFVFRHFSLAPPWGRKLILFFNNDRLT